jgi:hypothetical protein
VELTPYSLPVIFPQDEHERMLVATLEHLAVSVERNTELLGYSALISARAMSTQRCSRPDIVQ